MSITTEKVLMRRIPSTAMPGSATRHFAGTIQADSLLVPFRAHMDRVVQRVEADNGLFQDLGAMTLIASIWHCSESARDMPEIAAELETFAEQFSKVELPHSGAELQLLVRRMNELDYFPVC